MFCLSDSPMVLDQSMDYSRIQDETPEQRFDRLLSVPEYADEVYTYLRELEVCAHDQNHPGCDELEMNVLSKKLLRIVCLEH